MFQIVDDFDVLCQVKTMCTTCLDYFLGGEQPEINMINATQRNKTIHNNQGNTILFIILKQKENDVRKK